jgi:hypothetical protein
MSSTTATAQRPLPTTPSPAAPASSATPTAAPRSISSGARATNLSTFGQLKSAGGAAYNLYALPGAVSRANRDIRAAFRNPTADNVNRAVVSGTGAAKTALNATKDTLTIAGQVQNYRMARNAASAALRAASPAVSETAARAASRAAASAAVRGASRQVTRAAVRSVAPRAAQVAATAARAALRSGGSAVARAAGRFAPGANIAIAALDTASAVATLRDRNASTGRKVCSVITAVGSIAAATNIPIVSQAGAVISTVSSFIGGLFR